MIIDTYTFFVIIHIIGVAVGAGAAFMSDAIFISAVKDKVFSEAEVRILKLMSLMVWIGLAILIISGAYLWLTNFSVLLESSKFLAKLTIIAILTLNGVVFHVLHLPAIVNRQDRHMLTSERFVHRMPLMIASGAISIVSWMAALVLGVLSSLPFVYAEIMSFYFVAVLVATATALFVERDLLKRHS